ncbi:hypothetical protein LJB99_02085 [Deltaproteobacteria bacterium OttesenSCG-928-K17]|nr:hypothetical protein [Deltaproteobacteria bacterium OttesenSCG-928-K17]
MKFYRKIVIVITCFFAFISGVILISGGGEPALRLLVGAVFIVSFLNLTVYVREFGQWLNSNVKSAGTHLAAVGKNGEQNKGGGKNKDGKGRQPKGKSGDGKKSGGKEGVPAKSLKPAKKRRPADDDDDFDDDDFDDDVFDFSYDDDDDE